ncbi:hypothetical protein JCM8547_002706 [Rhodosporidiobolus lusitaniae]
MYEQKDPAATASSSSLTSHRSTSTVSSDFSSSSSTSTYSADYEELADDEDEGFDDASVDHERPFPSPSKAHQEKYSRRAEPDSPILTSSSSPTLSTTTKGKTAVTSWADPSLLPPTSAHFLPTSAAPSLPTVSTTTATASAISQLNKLSPFESYYHPPASELEHPDDRYPRGRNPHPRLLWRSSIDSEALAVLDAHHDRIVGGPLPRLSPIFKGEGAEGEGRRKRLSASGVERERDHAGAREEGERGRSRSERRYAAGWRGRREWSVEGTRWSREVEKCGL